MVDTLRVPAEVRYLGLTLGRAQIVIEAFFRDHEHLFDFQTGVVATLPGVTAVETAIVVRVGQVLLRVGDLTAATAATVPSWPWRRHRGR